LVPTLLGLSQVETPAAELSGTSLLPDIFGDPALANAARPVFVDMAEGPHNAERRAFIDADQKLILSGGRVLGLYDLAADPAERRDLSADKARVEQAQERFREFRAGLREIVVRAPR